MLRVIQGGNLDHLEPVVKELTELIASGRQFDEPERVGELLFFLGQWVECSREGSRWIADSKSRRGRPSGRREK